MTRALHWVLIKGWPLVATAAVCGAAIGYFFVFGGNQTFTSKVTLYVAPPISSSPSDAVMGDQYADNRTQLYLQLISSDALALRVAGQLQPSEPFGALSARVSAVGLHEAPMLEIEARGSTPDEARSLAQAYMDQLPEYARSVEQDSGLREGPVLVPTAGPTEPTGAATGLKPWLTVAFVAVAFACAALLVVKRWRHSHPTSRNVAALRSAVPTAFIAKVGDDPDDLVRLQALLLAAPRASRRIIFASARREDGLEAVSAEFTRSLRAAEIPCHHVKVNDLENFRHGADSSTVVILDAPELLQDSRSIAVLSSRASTAVIVVRKADTLVADVAELDRLLGLNGIAVKGIVSARGYRGGARRRNKVANPPPKALESAMIARGESRVNE